MSAAKHQMSRVCVVYTVHATCIKQVHKKHQWLKWYSTAGQLYIWPVHGNAFRMDLGMGNALSYTLEACPSEL